MEFILARLHCKMKRAFQKYMHFIIFWDVCISKCISFCAIAIVFVSGFVLGSSRFLAFDDRGLISNQASDNFVSHSWRDLTFRVAFFVIDFIE